MSMYNSNWTGCFSAVDFHLLLSFQPVGFSVQSFRWSLAGVFVVHTRQEVGPLPTQWPTSPATTTSNSLQLSSRTGVWTRVLSSQWIQKSTAITIRPRGTLHGWAIYIKPEAVFLMDPAWYWSWCSDLPCWSRVWSMQMKVKGVTTSFLDSVLCSYNFIFDKAELWSVLGIWGLWTWEWVLVTFVVV